MSIVTLHNYMVPKRWIIKFEKFSHTKPEILTISLIFEKEIAQLLWY